MTLHASPQSAGSCSADKLPSFASVLDPVVELEEQNGAARVREHDVAEQHTHQIDAPDMRCDGCRMELRDQDVGTGLEANVLDQRCPECGYITCSNCTLTRIQGTCRCPNVNFGVPYCGKRPEWYHGRNSSDPDADVADLIERYSGDRHPEDEPDIREDCFEDGERTCGNCGQRKRCLREEFRMRVEYKPGSATERLMYMGIAT